MEVTLMEMLEAREKRALRQQALLREFGRTLICFTMNIAGPVKNSPSIRRGFGLGKRLLLEQLRVAGIPVLHAEQSDENTGCELLLVPEAEPLTVKALTAQLEEYSPLGRLFDMDVLRPDAQKVDRRELGLPGRKCLLCGGPAAACARSRTHTVAQLQEKTNAVLEEALREADSNTIARLACQSLLCEVAATPKPGLVDRANSGSHRDMDFFSFQASAAALWPYFRLCAQIGMDTRSLPPEETFARLRFPGKLAEGDMLRATGGVNTHKGAIFSMGILCGALGRLEARDRRCPETVLEMCAAMTKGLVSGDYAGITSESARTSGERLYLQYGITGVRGQAEAGFPAVGKVGLPRLEEALARGLDLNDAGCAALLAMLCAQVDTNLVHRGGYETLRRTMEEISDLLAREPFPGHGTLKALDEDFIRKNLSPGGTADLLAMVYMLHLMKEEEDV